MYETFYWFLCRLFLNKGFHRRFHIDFEKSLIIPKILNISLKTSQTILKIPQISRHIWKLEPDSVTGLMRKFDTFIHFFWFCFKHSWPCGASIRKLYQQPPETDWTVTSKSSSSYIYASISQHPAFSTQRAQGSYVPDQVAHAGSKRSCWRFPTSRHHGSRTLERQAFQKRLARQRTTQRATHLVWPRASIQAQRVEQRRSLGSRTIQKLMLQKQPFKYLRLIKTHVKLTPPPKKEGVQKNFLFRNLIITK